MRILRKMKLIWRAIVRRGLQWAFGPSEKRIPPFMKPGSPCWLIEDMPQYGLRAGTKLTVMAYYPLKDGLWICDYQITPGVCAYDVKFMHNWSESYGSVIDWSVSRTPYPPGVP